MTITKTFARRLASWTTLAALLLTGAAQAQTVVYYHTDALGSPVATTDAAGTVLERTEYEPYGQVLNHPIADGPGYTGHVSDAQTGLSYMQQRYYDPLIGRFLSMDPVTADAATGGNFNRYWYANNNPYKFTDPDGRQSFRMQVDSNQARSLAQDSTVQQRVEAGEARVAPKSISIEAGTSAEAGTPAMGAGAQGGVGIKLSMNSAPGLADNFYATQGAFVGGLPTGSVSTASSEPTKDYAAGLNASRPGISITISNEDGGVREGTTRAPTLSTPIGTFSWYTSGDGDWSITISGPALGASYKEQTVRTCSECLK